MEKEKLTRRFEIRLSEYEYNLLEQLEKQSAKNRSEIIRGLLFSQKKLVSMDFGELLNKLDTIGNEMGRIGSNINQIARFANVLQKMGKYPTEPLKEFNGKLPQYILTLEELEKLLRKILRVIANST